MRRLRWTMLVGLVCGVAAAHTSYAATYYVAPSPAGNDANAGTQAAPWRTLQRAANVVNAGDTVHVLDGNYQGFDLRRSGTAGNPISFKADGPNVRITADNGVTPDGINVENAAYVVLDGFIADNRTRTGIRAAVAQFITIRNCHLGYNGRWGILTGFVDDLLVENNETHHSVAEHGIYAGNSGDRPIIRNNLVHDNHANGIHINADASQGGDGTISGALVEGNVIYGNGAAGGSGINMDGVVDSVVRNNLLYDNHASGISLYQIDGATGSTNNVVVNNTIVNAANGRWCVNISGGSTGAHVRNNILYNLHSFRGVITIDAASRPGFVSDYNSLMSRFSIDGGDSVIAFAAWQGLGYDTHSLLALPADHFVVPGSDFHLLAVSPAIDAGTATEAPAVDLEGVPRPQGASVDLGAYERLALGPSPTPTFTALPTLTRTPTPPATQTPTRTASGTATRTGTATATRTGTATATATGTATATATPVATTYAVSGALRYYAGNWPVAGAIAELSGSATHSAASDAAGQFQLTGVPGGTWQLVPRKTGDRGAGISALDAAYVLQHVAGMRHLDAQQQLACDVTGNGALSALDATRILQLAVGLQPTFGAVDACGSDWLFVPQPPNGAATAIQPLLSTGTCQRGAVSFAALGADALGQDFRALLIGDCTGNWTPPASGATAGAVRTRTAVKLTRLLPLRGGHLRAALLLRAAGELQSLEVVLNLDPARLRLARVRPALTARGALVSFNEVAPGSYALALASPRAIAPGARLALVLELVPLAPDPAAGGIALDRVRINE